MKPLRPTRTRPKPDRDLTELAQLDALVERTTQAMRIRLHEKHWEGRRGWKRRVTDLLERFDRACARRDFLDACNLAAMLYDYQQRNAQRPVSQKRHRKEPS